MTYHSKKGNTMTKERLLQLTHQLQDEIVDTQGKYIDVEKDNEVLRQLRSARYEEAYSRYLQEGVEEDEADRMANEISDMYLDRIDYNGVTYYQERLKHLNEQLEIYSLAMKCITHPNF